MQYLPPVDADSDPFRQFSSWFQAARQSEISDPEAMNVATCALDGHPSSRIVLLKHFDANGFVFYTNLTSRKGEQLHVNPHAAACFHWKSLQAQVRIEGSVTVVAAEEADAYFLSRPRESQIGAWASKQSHPMRSRVDLHDEIADATRRFAGHPVPRPPVWSGFRLIPNRVEFWKAEPFRLHNRIVYTRDGANNTWTANWLYP